MAPTNYFGLKRVSMLFDVSPGTVSKWLTRYAATDHPCPTPDAWIDGVPGWSESRASEWKAWKLSLPGRGAGGGPLPIGRARREYEATLDQVRQDHPDASASHQTRRAIYAIAEAYGVEGQTAMAIFVQIGEKRPDLSSDELDVLTVATIIRSKRAHTTPSIPA